VRARQYLTHPAVLGAFSVLFACGAVVWDWVDLFDVTVFCQTTTSGANIDHALLLVFVGGIGGFLLTLIVSGWRRLLVASLLLDAAMVSVAVALVALDSATYRTRCTGFFSSATSRESAHVTHLYFVWGAAIIVLLAQVVRVLRDPPKPLRGTRAIGHGRGLPDVVGQPDDFTTGVDRSTDANL
jgi:hypothetical protein